MFFIPTFKNLFANKLDTKRVLLKLPYLLLYFAFVATLITHTLHTNILLEGKFEEPMGISEGGGGVVLTCQYIVSYRNKTDIPCLCSVLLAPKNDAQIFLKTAIMVHENCSLMATDGQVGNGN